MTPNSQVHPKKLAGFVEGEHYRLEDRGHDTPCWIWIGWLDPQGYGRTTNAFANRRAHRESWVQANGPIPDGHHIHHRCHVRPCINPAHLAPTAPSAHLSLHKQDDSDLGWNDVREIRRLHQADEASIFEIGERYGLGKSQVWKIVTGASWTDPAYSPGRPMACDECGDEFLATRRGQRFCCKKHRYTFNNRKNWAQRHAA